MDVAGVVNRVKRQFGDEAGVQIVDTDIVNWINDAQLHITSSNDELLQETSTANLVANQMEYALPADLLTLFSVSIKNSGSLSYNQIKFYSVQDFNELINGWDGTFYGSGLPYAYTVFDGTIKLFPPPQTAAVSGIKYYYNRSPVVLAAPVGNLDLPLQYHNAIVNFCLQQAYEMDENFQASAMKQSQVDLAMHSNRHNDDRRAQEFYPTITVLADDL